VALRGYQLPGTATLFSCEDAQADAPSDARLVSQRMAHAFVRFPDAVLFSATDSPCAAAFLGNFGHTFGRISSAEGRSLLRNRGHGTHLADWLEFVAAADVRPWRRVWRVVSVTGFCLVSLAQALLCFVLLCFAKQGECVA
jgi:hypothetical protein